MLEMNTTPLIDVMLVLLVMLIITIPPQSHAVKIDLPGVEVPLTDPIKNLLVVTREGGILWNGEAVSKRQLRVLLDTTAAMDPRPELQLRRDAAARYALVDEVLAMTKQAGVQSMGFVGNDAYMRAF
jgi:biopolymer transport protein ExbD